MPKKKCHDVDGAYFGCSFANILLVVLFCLYLGLLRFSSEAPVNRFRSQNIRFQNLRQEGLQVLRQKVEERIDLLHPGVAEEIEDKKLIEKIGNEIATLKILLSTWVSSMAYILI